MKIHFSTIAIVGTGAMGRGIAQIAAQAGSRVWLLDTQTGAAEKAKQALLQSSKNDSEIDLNGADLKKFLTGY